MLTEAQKQVINNFAKSGIIRGGELLLTREYILQFIDDLAAVNAIIYGCSDWRYVDYAKYPDLIMEIVGGGILVEDDIDAQEECVNIVKGYITNRLPDDVDFVSLIFGDGDIYNYVREIGRSL